MTHAAVLYQDGRLTVTESAVTTPSRTYPVADLQTLIVVPRPAERQTGNRLLLSAAALALGGLGVLAFTLNAGTAIPLWLFCVAFGGLLLLPLGALVAGAVRRTETYDVQAGYRGKDVILTGHRDKQTAVGIGTAVVEAMRRAAAR
jgi:hypothetical protein